MSPEEQKIRSLELDLGLYKIMLDQLKTRVINAEKAMEDREASYVKREQSITRKTDWEKQCVTTAIEAINFLSDHGRAQGGEDRFNELHLTDIKIDLRNAFLKG